MRYLTWLWRNSFGERFNMGVRVVAGILQVVLGLSAIWLSKKFIDETIRTGSARDVAVMAVMLALVVTAGVLLRQLVYYMNVKCCTRGTNRLRARVFGCIFIRKLFSRDTLHSGDVSSRVMKDVETISDVNFDKLPQMIVTTTQLVGAFLMMRWFDPRLAWILLLMTPAVLGFGKIIARRLRRMTVEIRESESRVQMHVQECAEHDAVIRSMESESFVEGMFRNMQGELLNRVMVRSRFSVLVRILIGLVFGLGYMLAFVWGGIGLRNGTITFGVMTSFLQLVGQIQHPILNLLNSAPQIVHATASIDRLNELLQKGNSIQGCTLEQNKNDAEKSVYEGVRFRNVSFAYAGDEKNILKNVNYDFRPGKKVALMGETGAGKTTLFRLMLGLVKPTAGSVELYSDAVSDVAIAGEATRKNFAFVPQGNSLFSGTLRLNMQMARPDVTDAEIMNVLKISCADFVDKLPDGLDTVVGEHGFGFSEGEAQRLAIARGLLQEGSILLLDEISSALDGVTEQELYRRLFEAFPQKTMIFITHREAVCALCDEIVHVPQA